VSTSIPHDRDAELAILATLVVNPIESESVRSIVCGNDFFDQDVGKLYDAILTLHDAGTPIGDPIVLAPALRAMGVPSDVRTSAFIGRLMGRGIPWHAERYARMIAKSACLRRLQSLGSELVGRCSDPSADPESVMAWMDAKLASRDRNGPTSDRSVWDIASEVIADLRKPSDQRERPIMTGLRCHDESAGGWLPGELIFLAARPGVGKTTLGLQIAGHNALRDRPTLVVSLEMSDTQLVRRFLCGIANVNARRFRSERYTAADVDALEDAALPLKNTPLWVWGPAGASIPRIRGLAKRRKAESGLSLLVVDYLSLIHPDDRSLKRYEQISRITKDLKALAQELSVPVLALCQLNRDADGEEPRLSHLREGGSIEEDADGVLFLHRTEKAPDETTLIIAKHRYSETGMVTLSWTPERTEFGDARDFGGYADHIVETPISEHPSYCHDFDAHNAEAKQGF